MRFLFYFHVLGICFVIVTVLGTSQAHAQFYSAAGPPKFDPALMDGPQMSFPKPVTSNCGPEDKSQVINLSAIPLAPTPATGTAGIVQPAPAPAAILMRPMTDSAPMVPAPALIPVQQSQTLSPSEPTMPTEAYQAPMVLISQSPSAGRAVVPSDPDVATFNPFAD